MIHQSGDGPLGDSPESERCKGSRSVPGRTVPGRRVAVLGLGETGLASALFLKNKGYEVFVSEIQKVGAGPRACPEPGNHRGLPLQQRVARLEEEKIRFELGKHSFDKITRCDWVLISPGISPSTEIYQRLRQKRIPLLSEIEVASWFSPGELIAVTGTSGKSTVTTLLSRIFQANGFKSVACGNIGNPWIGELDRITSETRVVLEVSSFQLLHAHSFHPQGGILLNIGLNHLDWHPTMEDYVAAKLRLFQNQTADDFALIRRQDQKSFFPHFPFRSKVVYFGEKEEANSNEELLYQITQLKGLNPDKTREVLSGFKGLEHRLEKVKEIQGVWFVNDSKCTTLEALVWALNKFPDQRVILLAGGHAKGADFRRVRDRLSKKVKQAVVYGEAQDLLWESWRGTAPLVRTADLEGAFEEALKIARPGDTVLLSPACASFDQFRNYEERGKAFKALVEGASLRPLDV